MPTIKRGDTPTLRWQIAAGGTPVNLTGWEVRLLVRPRGSNELMLNEVVTGSSTGVVEYVVAVDDFAVGFYDAEIQTSSGGTILTYPDDGFDLITVVEDLGP